MGLPFSGAADHQVISMLARIFLRVIGRGGYGTRCLQLVREKSRVSHFRKNRWNRGRSFQTDRNATFTGSSPATPANDFNKLERSI
jgi:hypothetical protein